MCLVMVIGLLTLLPTYADHPYSGSFKTTITPVDGYGVDGLQTIIEQEYDRTHNGIRDTEGGSAPDDLQEGTIGALFVPITFEREVTVMDGENVSSTAVDILDFAITIYDSTGLSRTYDIPNKVRATDPDTGLAFQAPVTTTRMSLKLQVENWNTANSDIHVGDVVSVALPANVAQYANFDATIQEGLDGTLGDAAHGRGWNEAANVQLEISRADTGSPNVYSLRRIQTETEIAGFDFPGVRGTFQVEVFASELLREFKSPDQITVTNGTIDSIIVGGTPTLEDMIDPDGDGVGDQLDFDRDGEPDTFDFDSDPDSDGTGPGTPGIPGDGSDANGFETLDLNDDGENDQTTGQSESFQIYLVTITPNLLTANDVVIRLGTIEDWSLPTLSRTLTTELSVPVDPSVVQPNPLTPTNNTIGADPNVKRVTKQWVIPANGYLVLVNGDEDESGVVDSPPKPANKKTDAEKLYNVIYDFTLDFPANDLANFFRNGGTLQLLHTDIARNATGANGDMGYSGASEKTYSAGDVIINEIMWGVDRTEVTSQYIELHNTTSSAIGIDENEWLIAWGQASASTLNTYTVIDTVSNTNPYWEVPGSSGATVATPGYPLTDMVSMSRIDADGSDPNNWEASTLPATNIRGLRIGSPGAANTPGVRVPPPPPITPVAAAGDLQISEIMMDTNAGRTPQWLEIANVSGSTVKLTGWSISILNYAADGIPSSNTELDAYEIPAGQVLLIVSDDGTARQGMQRMNDSRIHNFDRVFLSQTSFLISLVPPTGTGDAAGNLTGDWTLPKAEFGRASLTRGAGDGTEAASWSLTTAMHGAYAQTYYGHEADVGTPGWHGAGGALPVELSLFIAKRDRLTGAVEIRWETQSETNNAGFFIKRSETRNGTFEVINPVMIPGAGTTSEKQSYTYADATAKPNAVYYYQIEDVSLDGERQTLTAAHRLKGHLSAAGKAAVTWGTLKSQE